MTVNRESFQHNEHRLVENLLCVCVCVSSFALFLHQGSFSGEKTESPGVAKGHMDGTISNLPLTAGPGPPCQPLFIQMETFRKQV